MRTLEEIRSSEWFGSVPNGWSMVPIKSLFSISKGMVVTKADLTESGAMVVNYGQVHSKCNDGLGFKRDLLRYVPESIVPSSLRVSEYGSFIFACTSEDLDGCGACVYNNSELALYPGGDTLLLRPKGSLNNKYFAYLFTTDTWRWQLRRGLVDVKVFHVNKGNISEAYIIVPPNRVQRDIVAYLDPRCASIDSDIERRRRIIAKLSEYRKALITSIIATGLNEHTEMAQSEVEYIEEYPSHWKCLKFKHIAKVASNLVQPERYPDYQQVSPDCVEKDTGRLLKKQTVREAGVESNNHLYHGGMILYSKVRPLLNKATISVADGLCSADMYPIQTTQCVKWLLYYMLSDLFTRQVKAVSELRIKMPKVNSTELGEVWLLMPPKDEQEEIAMYLDTRTAEIDAIIAREEQLIDKLNEYKKSLIYHAVTGKIDCSEEVDNG